MESLLPEFSSVEVERLAAEAEEWVASGAGRRALEEAFERAESTSIQLFSERIVDIQTLRAPLSI